MSTFNGIIDEFPNIRIDYFRRHPDRDPPQACFLSHVHSDHLQGLETLKMPFVYCSAATKSILLRMEKYPHRINFAKGILEARKQTYRHLRLVLRTLPLETPVELELGPKSRIRVTLFDANHCPGAVMFLIEGDGKAILYTGDMRAEPWWTNSIVRNPILIPYSCGKKRLDCVYLDTTFATRDHVHQAFPTKAEGLQELLTRVEKCPQSSTFYFRSWTLGYEDVWIALSNYLQASVHVDDYQMRIFKALADVTNTIDRGSSLVGFKFGNQYQGGCLTDDVEAQIHSCEPGSECHDEMKKRNDIVWITPIVSRLEDGTEVAELGAGGGGGDLYHAPQLEMIDEKTLAALEELCASTIKHKEALIQLGEAFANARDKGNFNISLGGLGLDQDEEMTLKDFVRLISSKGGFSKSATESSEQPETVIRFPYSRHSSYSELSNFLSMFQPNDICPCTVDIDNWSEDVSIESLFGELCSEKIFRFDVEARARVQERKTAEAMSKGRKRKRQASEDISQRARSQNSRETEELFKSAQTSIREDNEDNARQPQRQNAKDRPIIAVPSQVERLQRAVTVRFYQDDDSAGGNALSQADPSIQASRTCRPDDIDTSCADDEITPIPPFLPLSPSAFQPHNDEIPSVLGLSPGPREPSSRRHRPDVHSPPGTPTPLSPPLEQSHRTRSRKCAYRAARKALDQADFTAWQALRLRSMGWKGHTEEEQLL